MKDTLIIHGGNLLQGSIKPQGAKNEAFQVLATTLLTEELVTLHNLPDIIDVQKFFEILKILGVKITDEKQVGSFTFDSSKVDPAKMETSEFIEKFSHLRGSLTIAGAMLARFGVGYLTEPGGDKIGIRPVAVHHKAFVDLGAQLFGDKIILDKFKDELITLNEASVTGTANVILASVLKKGSDEDIPVRIYNAACEPYIQQLCDMLNRMGAKINGAGTNLIVINPVTSLVGCEHRLLPDMIEIGSLICLAVVCGNGITLKGAHFEHLGDITLRIFKKLGVTLEDREAGIYIPRHDSFQIKEPTTTGKRIRKVYDDRWPGLSPDHISCMIVMSLFAKGKVTFDQRMFDRRLLFCDTLNQMGADIIMSHHQSVSITSEGKDRLLVGISMSSPDIRAGMALVIAALAANGTSVIQNAHQIHRGYENIVERLQALGADIKSE